MGRCGSYICISTYVLVWLYLFCVTARERVAHGTIQSLFLTFLFRFLFICLFISFWFFLFHLLTPFRFLSSLFVAFFTSFFLSISLWFQFFLQGQRQGIFVCNLYMDPTALSFLVFVLRLFNLFFAQKCCGLLISNWSNDKTATN
jgi:hypothetical protein